MAQKKRGRPKAAHGTRNQSLLVRMGAAEKQAFAVAAQISGVPVSSWIRERLRRAATRELAEANLPNPLISEDR